MRKPAAAEDGTKAGLADVALADVGVAVKVRPQVSHRIVGMYEREAVRSHGGLKLIKDPRYALHGPDLVARGKDVAGVKAYAERHPARPVHYLPLFLEGLPDLRACSRHHLQKKARPLSCLVRGRGFVARYLARIYDCRSDPRYAGLFPRAKVAAGVEHEHLGADRLREHDVVGKRIA